VDEKALNSPESDLAKIMPNCIVAQKIQQGKSKIGNGKDLADSSISILHEPSYVGHEQEVAIRFDNVSKKVAEIIKNSVYTK